MAAKGSDVKYILLFLLLISPALADNYEFLGDFRSYQIHGGELDIETANRPLRLFFAKNAVVRVLMGAEAHQSDTVVGRLEPAEIKVEDKGDSLLVTCNYAKVTVKKSPLRLTVARPDGTVLVEDDPGFGHGWDHSEVRTWKRLAPDEKFFGLGEKTGSVNKRGRFWTMWNSDIPGYTNDTDPIYGSIPFLLGRRAGNTYGIFLDNTYRSTFNLGAGNERLYSFGATDGVLDYYLFLGPDAKSILDAYTRLTGRMTMPPKWALGYQQCRWSYYPDYEVRDVARNFRQRKIPADVIYLDIHFMDAYKVFTWDAQRFPDPEGLLSELKTQGFKVVTIIDPGVKVEPGYSVHDQGLAGDYFLKYLDGSLYQGQVWPGWCYFPDFRKESTRHWWGELNAKHRAKGVAGFWNDMNEPAVWGREMPLVVEGIKKLHNVYAYLEARATYEGLLRADPTLRPFVVTRASYAGIQKYAAVWTGDNSATYDDMALSVRMCLGLGVSGVPFVGPDIGGFIGRPTPELYARWIELGSMMPFMRSHTTRDTPDQEPWSLGEEVEDISRDYITRRYELMPYLYSLFHEAHQTGVPVMRPLWLEFAGDQNCYDVEDEFLLGPALLVAPVLQQGQRFRKVYLPSGKWWDSQSQKMVKGGQDVLVEAPLGTLPVYQREGSIVCRRPATQWVDEKPLQTLRLEAVAGKGAFDLKLDDGLTQDAPVETVHLSQSGALTVDGRPGPRVDAVRELQLTWHGAGAGKLLLDGKPTQADYDRSTDTWTVKTRFFAKKLTFQVQ